ncbi:MAG: RES family NAD+ phosphorylase [Pseudomonadota bacterium]|nr:RES family NAD+ phosphorylase [Pseudomonadota bacterium]
MIVWRFSRHESLDGRGGLLASARWHTRGQEILYCAPNPATAVLEILVHSQVRAPAALSRHRFIKLEVPEEISLDAVDEAQLPTDWSRRLSVTRAWGDRWLREGSSAVLAVRSVLVPETYNLIINPRHRDAVRIKRVMSFPYPLDSRLL